MVRFIFKRIDIASYLQEFKTTRYRGGIGFKKLGKIRIMITLFSYHIIWGRIRRYMKEVLFENDSEYSKKRNFQICSRPEFVSLIKETNFLLSKSNQFYIIQDPTDDFIIWWIQAKEGEMKRLKRTERIWSFTR